jgi:UDP-N-acetyl-D-mannosaminuronic acid dehydrogenase
LDIVVHAVVTEGLLHATTVPQAADAFLIAVPTPFQENHHADLCYVKSACLAIAPVLKKGDLIILESTSPVGTTEKIAEWLAFERQDLVFPNLKQKNTADVYIAYCPERVLPGHILRELVSNDRIIGGMTSRCAHRAVQLYKTFVEGECIITDARTAEICKLTENSFRDVNIAFANELSIICDKLDVNVWELLTLANRHPRVNILQPGPGVGGHCIAVDPWFIVSQLPEEARLIRIAREVNDSKPAWVVEKVKQAVAEFVRENPAKTANDVTITCLGLTFKENIVDTRESPALRIAEDIADLHRGPLFIVEPYLTQLPPSLQGKAVLKLGNESMVETDVLLILVEHTAFTSIFKNIPQHCKVVDTRGVLFEYLKENA